MMRALIFTFVICLMISGSAFAEGVVVQNKRKVKFFQVSPVSDENVLDMYSRQLQYRQTRISHKRDMEERRESFARPARRAREAYAAQLSAMNSSRQDWRGDR